MSKLAKALTAAAGNAGESLYVEDVFSTYLYTGTGGADFTVTNGINLADEGGIVWKKQRNGVADHLIYQAPGVGDSWLVPNSTAALATGADYIDFTTTGFVDRSGDSASNTYASWTFRKAEKFFDVVTWTGDGTSPRSIAHNLNGGQPGCIIVKRTDAASDWMTFNLDGSIYRNLVLNSSAAENATRTATDIADESVIKVSFMEGWAGIGNASGETYVAYLFASDAGGFGDDGSENIIKCGSFTTDGSGNASVDCGFEPQWVLVKPNLSGFHWYMNDSMRPWPTDGNTNYGNNLYANLSNAEGSNDGRFYPTANGFSVYPSQGIGTGTPCIYIAIRRPMKTPESGTEVFQSLAYTGDGASTRNFDLDLTLDAYFQACRSSSTYDFKNLTARLTGKGLYTAGTGAEFATNTSLDVQDGLRAIGFENTLNQSGETYIINGFKRATGFFDVVAYTGDSASSRDITHNLSAVPELIMLATRTTTNLWPTYHKDLPDPNPTYPSFLRLNTNGGISSSGGYYSATPTESVFTIGGDLNASGQSYISYLFATVAGVSKVGSYTGTGADLNVDCGFSAGARFILIKRTDSTGDWYVWDSARGIVAGNDPYLLLNSTAAEVTSTDYIDPLSSGFTVTSSAPAALNASGGSYIFMAIS